MRDLVSQVAGRLKAAIDLRNQSIREFAAEVGVPYKTLQDYLAGKRLPGAEHLVRLAAAGLDVGWLLTGRAPLGYRSFLDEVTSKGSATAGDERLLALVEREAYKAADEYARRRRSKGGTPLTAYQAALVFGYYLRLLVSHAAEVYKKSRYARLRTLGVGLVIDLSAVSNSPDLDLKIDQILAAEDRGERAP